MGRGERDADFKPKLGSRPPRGAGVGDGAWAVVGEMWRVGRWHGCTGAAVAGSVSATGC